MIAYDLKCSNHHQFEGWFEDRKAYLGQKKKGLIACPICDDTAVSRIPSTFAIKASSPPVPAKAPPADDQLAQLGKKIVDYVTENFDDVGSDFANEALKIHYGAVEPRNIRGVSTQAEEKMLKEEGVDYVKFPMPAESPEESENTDS
jgi:hypothetical protein